MKISSKVSKIELSIVNATEQWTKYLENFFLYSHLRASSFVFPHHEKCNFLLSLVPLEQKNGLSNLSNSRVFLSLSLSFSARIVDF